MSGKRNWGSTRMDGHEPPPLVEREEKKPPNRSWRKLYACKPVKGDHRFEPVKPSYCRDAEERLMSVGAYYQHEHTKRMSEPQTSWWYSRGVMIYWRCKHCGKREYDFSDRPNLKKVRQFADIPAWLRDLTTTGTSGTI